MFIYVLKTIGVVSAWFTKFLRIHISIITRRTKKTLTCRKKFFFSENVVGIFCATFTASSYPFLYLFLYLFLYFYICGHYFDLCCSSAETWISIWVAHMKTKNQMKGRTKKRVRMRMGVGVRRGCSVGTWCPCLTVGQHSHIEHLPLLLVLLCD